MGVELAGRVDGFDEDVGRSAMTAGQGMSNSAYQKKSYAHAPMYHLTILSITIVRVRFSNIFSWNGIGSDYFPEEDLILGLFFLFVCLFVFFLRQTSF